MIVSESDVGALLNERTKFLRSMLPLHGVGLEIGPGYNPLVPKSEGFNVETADYTDQKGLQTKYYNNPHVSIDKIEIVDHLIDGSKELWESVGHPGKYSYIVASHVIEHTPDMLGFLQSCEKLLAPEGVLLLAVPDKRHCFDVFQPLSSTGSVLQAHLDGRTRPMPGTIFDDVAYNALRGNAIGWKSDDHQPLKFFSTLENATSAYEIACRSSDYRDVHVWRFVPSSFRLIISDLYDMGAMGLCEDAFYDSIGNEFYATLSVNASGCSVDRLTLAKNALSEQAHVFCY